MDFSAWPRSYLFLRVLLAAFSNQRPDWSRWHFASQRISAGAGKAWAEALLVRERPTHADGRLLDWDRGRDSAGAERLAARHAGGVLPVFSVVRQRGTGFFGLSVGWDAAGSRVYFVFLRACRSAAWLRPA